MNKEALILAEISGGGFRSGEEISSKLGITRSAVWKHIAKLRQCGYMIEARPHEGYKLVSKPDKLLPVEITPRLETRTVGRRIVHFDSVDSTTRAARDLIDAGAAEGTVVIAESQTAGRGRLGKNWITRSGSAIAISVILYPDLPPSGMSVLSLATATAAARAIRKTTGIEPNLKWPNDIYFRGGKLGGVLVEISAELDRVRWVIDSIGINVNDDFRGTELEGEAISLREATGERVQRLDLLLALLGELDRLWKVMGDDRSMDRYRDEFEALDMLQGCEVSISMPGGSITGRAEGIDREGRLVVRSADGSISSVFSGEATLAP